MTKTGSTGILPDILFIGAVVLLSVALYTGGLGFYSDDWSIIAYLQSGPEHSLREILTLGIEFLPFRPGQISHLGVLYWAFGTDPLGYHIANAGMLVAASALFYLVLRELAQPRVVAVALPLVFILLPHYATVRFWAATFAGSVAMAAWLMSLYADLRVIRPVVLPAIAWKVTALIGLTVSIATYETFLPFLLAAPLLVWYRSRQADAQLQISAPRFILWFAPNVLLIVGLSLYKVQVDYRYVAVPITEHLFFFTGLVEEAARSAVLGDFGLRLPRTLLTIMREYPSWPVFTGALLTGLAIYAYLLKVASHSGSVDIEPRRMLHLCGAGVLVYVAGYSIFLTNFNAAITTTGSNNRTGMAAAIGLAMLIVGLAGWLSSLLLRGRWRHRFFSASLAGGAACGFLIINTVATSWVAAADLQTGVLAGIKAKYPELPAGTTLLLDGLCRYKGPAPVFETWWDTSGALRILYGDQSLVGDVVTPSLRIEEDGIYTLMYGQKHGPYAYDKLALFDVRSRSGHDITGPFTAATYFRTNNPTRSSGCPATQEGFGEKLF